MSCQLNLINVDGLVRILFANDHPVDATECPKQLNR
jgi:hypothetical protein